MYLLLTSVTNIFLQASMCGARMLRLVDLRLRNIFNSNRPWAGKHMILVGDLFQVSSLILLISLAPSYPCSCLCCLVLYYGKSALAAVEYIGP